MTSLQDKKASKESVPRAPMPSIFKSNNPFQGNVYQSLHQYGQKPSDQRTQGLTYSTAPNIQGAGRNNNTSTTFLGQGRPMDIDVAERQGLCFFCSQ